MEWNGPTADIGRKYNTLHSNSSRHTDDRFVCVCLFVILWQIMTFKWTGIPPKEFQCLSTFAVALTRTQLSARTGDKQRIKQRIIHTQEFKKNIATKALMPKTYLTSMCRPTRHIHSRRYTSGFHVITTDM
jgi:hypothetical protein